MNTTGNSNPLAACKRQQHRRILFFRKRILIRDQRNFLQEPFERDFLEFLRHGRQFLNVFPALLALFRTVPEIVPSI